MPDNRLFIKYICLLCEGSTTNSDKAKPAERRGRKATGPRFLRDGACDATKDPKTAGLPNIGLH
jgi:hypothetical protein